MVDVTVYELESYLTKGEFKAVHWGAIYIWESFLEWEQENPDLDRSQLGVVYYNPNKFSWGDDEYLTIEELANKAQAAQEKREKAAEVMRLASLAKKKRKELEVGRYNYVTRQYESKAEPAWEIYIDGEPTGLYAISKEFRNYYEVWTANGFCLTVDLHVRGLKQALSFAAVMWKAYKGWATVEEESLSGSDKEAIKRGLAFWRDTLSKA